MARSMHFVYVDNYRLLQLGRRSLNVWDTRDAGVLTRAHRRRFAAVRGQEMRATHAKRKLTTLWTQGEHHMFEQGLLFLFIGDVDVPLRRSFIHRNSSYSLADTNFGTQAGFVDFLHSIKTAHAALAIVPSSMHGLRSAPEKDNIDVETTTTPHVTYSCALSYNTYILP